MLIIFRNRENQKEVKKGSFEHFSTCQNQNDDYICNPVFLKKDNN